MIDASHEPFEKNVEITKRIIDRAHEKGISVEAELGQLGGVEEDIVGSVCLTEPDQAAEFVAKSGCDSLAVAIGTSHGAFKFSGKQGLRMDRIAEIQKVLPKCFPMVMHGSSSVPKEWVDRINAAGGKMKATSGVDENQYLPAAKLGVCKVNIDTDGRLVWCAIHRESFRDDPCAELTDDRIPSDRQRRDWDSGGLASIRQLRSARELRSAKRQRDDCRRSDADNLRCESGDNCRQLSG